MKQLTALGLTCGIGSMLIGARSAGFKVIGNIEWRKYYHTGTFEKNFPGTYMVKAFEEAPDIKNIDIVFSHPECGNFSNLRCNKPKFDDPGDIPLFIKMVKEVSPNYFVMDNLPKSLIAVPVEKYAEELPGYDLYPEWVSNYHYGNTQFLRRRFFLIGAKKEKKFTFFPGEFEHQKKLIDVIGDLPKKDDVKINHVHWRRGDVIPQGWAAHQFGIVREGNKITYGEMREFFKDYPTGKLFEYLNKKGERKQRPGYYRARLDYRSPVLTGGGSALDNHYREDTGMPFTQRERARIQGCPDNFIFYPLDFLRNPKAYACVYKQIGKFMPVEFCTYISEQIMAHERGAEFRKVTGKRLIAENPFINEAKLSLCRRKGSRRPCEACWLYPCSIQGNYGAPDHAGKDLKVALIRTPRAKIKAVKGAEKERINLAALKKSSTNTPDHAGKDLKVAPIRTYSVGPNKLRGKHPECNPEKICLKKGKILPSDYVGASGYAEKYRGELIRPDGTHYNRTEKNSYYSPMEKTRHPAKTPIHIARWAIQEFTREGDWVLDPTVGTGTTLVEALRLKRNAVGMEIEFVDLILDNVKMNNPFGKRCIILHGDARNIGKNLSRMKFSLIINNPPYSGDVRQYDMASRCEEKWDNKTIGYDPKYNNLAFLKENKEYWSTLESIYSQCIGHLAPGGRFVIGVKDMMRNREPFKLHEMIGDILSKYLAYEFMVVLKHYPPTLHLNTYEKKFGATPPLYQTILVFRKEEL